MNSRMLGHEMDGMEVVGPRGLQGSFERDRPSFGAHTTEARAQKYITLGARAFPDAERVWCMTDVGADATVLGRLQCCQIVGLIDDEPPGLAARRAGRILYDKIPRHLHRHVESGGTWRRGAEGVEGGAGGAGGPILLDIAGTALLAVDRHFYARSEGRASAISYI